MLIRTEDLVLRYPNGITALDRLNLDVGDGIIGLVGANGAGKSTFIKILLGLLPATSGKAEVFGLDSGTEGLKIRERIGYMPEHDCLPPDMSATNFVIHMARMSGIPPSYARERTAEILRHAGLYEERYRHIKGYSTGMKQRVKLAQALVHDPGLLLLDEPTNGLDPAGRDEMLDLVQRTGHSFGISIMMSSHLLGEIERVCDYLIVIDGGRLVQAGPLAELTAARSLLTVEVEWEAERLAAWLAERGIEARHDGRRLSVMLDPSEDGAVYRTITDGVAELGLPLVRLEQQRHTLEELFLPGNESGEGAAVGVA